VAAAAPGVVVTNYTGGLMLQTLKAEDVVAQGQMVNDDQGVTIWWATSQTWMEFQSKEHARQPDGSVIYYRNEGHLLNVPTPDFASANQLVGGFLKWDGCGEWEFGPDEDEGRMHFCGISDARRVFWCIEQVFRLAAEHMPSFDEDLAA
jgi:hypothetical protein